MYHNRNIFKILGSFRPEEGVIKFILKRVGPGNLSHKRLSTGLLKNE